MEFGVVIPLNFHFVKTETFGRLITAAEKLGYDSVWLADHIVIPNYATPIYSKDYLEPVASMLFGAGRTTRIKFGTDVLVMPYRHPVVLAKMLSTMDVLSRGRLILGIGSGVLKGEFEALGLPYERRGAMTDEYLRAMKSLWTESNPVFRGEFVGFSDVQFWPKPVQQPHPPIWVGGNSRRAMRRAAALGDGWQPIFLSPDEYRSGHETLTNLLAAAGRAGPFTFSYSCPPMRVTKGPWTTGDEIEIRVPPDLSAQLLEDYRSLAVAPPRAASGRPLLNGSPDEVAGDIQEFRKAGVTHMAARFYASGEETDEAALLERMESFAAEVIPRFRSREGERQP